MAKILDDEIEENKSKLKKDAMIYQQRDDTDVKKEYEALDRKGKWQFFKDYYLKTILFIAAVVVIGGAYVYRAITKPQTVLYIAICDDVFEQKQIDKLEKAVGTYLSLDPKHEVVSINTNYSHTNAKSNEQLQSYIYAGSCDVVISSKVGFQDLAEAGYFLEPKTSDTVSVFEKQDQSKRFEYPVIDGKTIRGEKPMDPTKYNFGVLVSDSAKYKALKGLGQEAVIGVTNSSKRQEEAAAFLEFMLDDSIKAGSKDPDFLPVDEK